ncbi:hypothetical protein HG535_0A05890 [Zygotorulaspora mrakii]|uniref:non-specific serine/threonine protein kinase n=1 Tax=Zygotorulaspora mrakii TaxID=42260 RepID=A0A7H9AW75_ZYGMR|nr:uncharacterized protein HG535_0A05890 [Zygotorulaspora mrakii]QLG70648.1 hypothetical protein HG535_0A05890 [Zygotorulaspora mrakii]
MASINKRYTYYGGETAVLSGSTITGNANGKAIRAQNKPRRKHVTFGPYILGSTLGEGEFGKVKLGWSKHSTTSSAEVPKQVAIKLIRRDTIPKNSEKEVKVYREINALKHLTHPNIVKLEEVLQNSKYIGIVLEYASGGEFYKYIQQKRRLKEGVACRLFAQLISGVQYMHSKGLVHRDLKLENLLLDKHENLIITDFGFVNEFFQHNELMKTSCGSPCYAAPELVVSTKPYEARKADVWSCGIILYAMLAGYLPWDDDPKNPDGNDIAKLYHYITRTPLKFPEYVNALPRDLLRRILVSDPKRRTTLRNIQRHEWTRPHMPFLSITPEEWDRTMVSKDVFRPPRLNSQRSTRPQSNCSTSSTSSKGDKRDSLIIDSTLVNLPAPPQESQSHVITIPSPPSPELRHSPIRGVNRHSRSNSAASIALQAVVDAEREHNLQRESFLHLQKMHHSTGNRASVPVFLNQRSNTHSNNSGNVSSLMNKDSVIVEASPAKNAKNNTSHPNIASQESSNMANLAASYENKNKTFKPKTTVDRMNHSSEKGSSSYHQLSSQHHKPRPTSYHPSSTASASTDSDAFPIVSAINGTLAHNMEPSPFDSVPSLSPDQKYSSFDHSPKMLPRRSFSVNKPSLDLQSVSGDLIRSQKDGETIAFSRINEQVEDADFRKRRQSRRFSALIGEKVFSPVTEEMEETAIVDEKPITIKVSAVTPDVNDPDGTGEKKLDIPDNKTEKKRFSFFSLYSTHNVSKSSLGSNDSKSGVNGKAASRNPSASPKTAEPRESRTTLHVVAPNDSEDSESSQISQTSAVAATFAPDVHRSTQSSRQTSSSDKSIAEKTTGGSNASKESQSIQRHASHNRSNGRTSSRVTNASNTSRSSHRQSVMVSTLNDNQQAQPRHTGDQSTARKVIDFFKRRSMRL